MTRPLALLAAVLLLVVSGCRHLAPRAECEAHGGASWREVTSAHFRITTNLDSEDAKQAAFELERARKALLFAWQYRVDPPGRVNVVILQTSKQLSEFADENIAGFVSRTGIEMTIVLPGKAYKFDGDPRGRAVLMHELAHYLSSYVLLRQPRWLSEGLASYLETTKPFGEGEVRMGEVQDNLLATAARTDWVTFEELWDWKSNSDLTPENVYRRYASSWLRVHFLLNRYPKEFAAFQDRLGRAEEPMVAWRASFSNVSFAELDEQVKRYIVGGNYSAYRYPMPTAPNDAVERVLSEADVHANRARLFLTAPNSYSEAELSERVNQELDLALQRDPNHLLANQLKVANAKTGEERVAAARELTKHHPDSAEAWLRFTEELFSFRSANNTERREAAVKALSLAPDHPSALNNLAWDYVLAGQPKVALPFASKAARIVPWSPPVLDTLAAALAGSNQCQNAVLIQRRAIDMLPENISKAGRDEYVQRLTAYEKGCVTPVAAPAAP